MSVTFWCPEAPRKTVYVPCDMTVWTDGERGVCSEKERCGYCGPDYWHDENCPEGMSPEERSPAPSLNVSNHNAGRLSDLLGLPRMCEHGGPYGYLAAKDIPPFLQAIMVALNNEDARSGMVEAGFDSHDQPVSRKVLSLASRQPVRQGARMISFGVTDESTVRRLRRLQEVFSWAVENDMEVTWG